MRSLASLYHQNSIKREALYSAGIRPKMQRRKEQRREITEGTTKAALQYTYALTGSAIIQDVVVLF